MKIKNFLLVSGLTALSIFAIPNSNKVNAKNIEETNIINSKSFIKVPNEVNLNIKYSNNELSIPVSFKKHNTHYLKINENEFNNFDNNKIKIEHIDTEINEALLTAKFNKNVNNTIKLVLNHKKNFFESINIFHNNAEEIVVKLTPETIDNQETIQSTENNTVEEKQVSEDDKVKELNTNTEVKENNTSNEVLQEDIPVEDNQILEYKLNNFSELESIEIEYNESEENATINKNEISMVYKDENIDKSKFEIVGNNIVIKGNQFATNQYVKIKVNEDIQLIGTSDNEKKINLVNEDTEISNLVEANKENQENEIQEEEITKAENISTSDIVPQTPIVDEKSQCGKTKKVIMPEQEGVIFGLPDVKGNKATVEAIPSIGYSFKEGVTTTWELDVTPIPCDSDNNVTELSTDEQDNQTVDNKDNDKNTESNEATETNKDVEEENAEKTQDNGVIVSLGENLNIIVPVGLGVLLLGAGTVLVIRRIRKN